jgi:hypothetical protein
MQTSVGTSPYVKVHAQASGGTPAAVTWFVNPTTAEHSSQRTLEVHVTLVMAVSIGWAVLISALLALVCLVARHNR